jgi:membrane protease YdiL (CAAX protease family)
MSSFLKIVFVPLAAALIALAITAYGQGLWGLLAIANLRVDPEFPWAAILMAFLLAGLLLYLAGFGPPVHTRTLRRSLLRWNTMPANVFLWALVAGIFGDIALGGIWIATSDLIHIPPGITPSMKGVPLPTAIAFLIMAALAAPLTEEAAFRGYAQGLLERAGDGRRPRSSDRRSSSPACTSSRGCSCRSLASISWPVSSSAPSPI